MSQSVVVITLAYILDLILGDPLWLPHPVKGIGWLAKTFELPLRRLIKNERLAGSIFVIAIVVLVWAVAFIAVSWASSIHRYLGMALSTILIYTSLAIKDLEVESLKVYHALEKEDLLRARKNLSLIVGRDTHNLKHKDIIRATVETISENIVDGIISPLFYAFLGGAPLVLAYKAVNTLDSMVGYKDERYKNFGWASARIDDLTNFIPARLSLLFIPVASWLAGRHGLNSWKVVWRDGMKNPSPNSGISEAAVSGALGVQLGGLNFYNSQATFKPIIGDNLDSLSHRHIRESIKISYICSALVLVSGIFLILLIQL